MDYTTQANSNSGVIVFILYRNEYKPTAVWNIEKKGYGLQNGYF